MLSGLATLVASGGLISGTGAFSSMDAQRRISVSTAGDNQSLLALEQVGDGTGPAFGRSVEGGTPERVAFSFPGTGEGSNLGLGTNSVYEFDRDSGESDDPDPTEGLLRITNQGTQTIEIYSEHQTSSELEIELYDVTDAEKIALRDKPPELNTGDSIKVGFRIQTFDAEIQGFDETLTIVADAV